MSMQSESKNLSVHTLDSFSEGVENFSINAFDQMCSLSHAPFPHHHAFYEIMHIDGIFYTTPSICLILS